MPTVFVLTISATEFAKNSNFDLYFHLAEAYEIRTSSGECSVPVMWKEGCGRELVLTCQGEVEGGLFSPQFSIVIDDPVHTTTVYSNFRIDKSDYTIDFLSREGKVELIFPTNL